MSKKTPTPISPKPKGKIGKDAIIKIGKNATIKIGKATIKIGKAIIKIGTTTKVNKDAETGKFTTSSTANKTDTADGGPRKGEHDAGPERRK